MAEAAGGSGPHYDEVVRVNPMLIERSMPRPRFPTDGYPKFRTSFSAPSPACASTVCIGYALAPEACELPVPNSFSAPSAAHASTADEAVLVGDYATTPKTCELPVPRFGRTGDYADTSSESVSFRDEPYHVDTSNGNTTDGFDLLITNVPTFYNEHMVAQEMNYTDEATFTVPMRRGKRSNMGYCFVNLPTVQDACGFIQQWSGQRLRLYQDRLERSKKLKVVFCHGSLQ